MTIVSVWNRLLDYLLDVEAYGWNGQIKVFFHPGRMVLLQSFGKTSSYYPELHFMYVCCLFAIPSLASLNTHIFGDV